MVSLADAEGVGVGTFVDGGTVLAAVVSPDASGVAVSEVPHARIISRNNAVNAAGTFLTSQPIDVRKKNGPLRVCPSGSGRAQAKYNFSNLALPILINLLNRAPDRLGS